MIDYNHDKLDSTAERKKARIKAIDDFIKDYSNRHHNRTGEQLNIQEYSAEKITELYFNWLMINVKPFVPKRINKFKIGSLTEMCIIKVQPFFFKSKQESRKINADFAFFVSISMIHSISMDVEDFNKPSGHARVEDVFNTAKDQRLQWLEAKNPNNFAVFSNGLSLFLLFELWNLRFQAISI